MFDIYASTDESMTYSDFLAAIIDINQDVSSDVIEKCFQMIDVE